MAGLDRFMIEVQEEMIQQARRQYSATVVDHWLHPRNAFVMSSPSGQARIKGPCNDTMEIFVAVSEDRVTEASFVTDGCITSIVSGSMAVELVTGRSLEHAREIDADEILQALDGLPETAQHCALLAANTLRAALASSS